MYETKRPSILWNHIYALADFALIRAKALRVDSSTIYSGLLMHLVLEHSR